MSVCSDWQFPRALTSDNEEQELRVSVCSDWQFPRALTSDNEEHELRWSVCSDWQFPRALTSDNEEQELRSRDVTVSAVCSVSPQRASSLGRSRRINSGRASSARCWTAMSNCLRTVVRSSST